MGTIRLVGGGKRRRGKEEERKKEKEGKKRKGEEKKRRRRGEEGKRKKEKNRKCTKIPNPCVVPHPKSHFQNRQSSSTDPPPPSRPPPIHLRPVCLFPNSQVEASIQERGVWYRLPGELWGWLLFYGGTASVAFGSAYYHLRPDDNLVLLDNLPKESEIADEFPFYFIHNHSPFGILLPYFCQMLHNIKLIHICADDDCLFLTFLYFYTRETRRKNWIKLPFFTSSSCCSKHKLCKLVIQISICFG
ncbi:hypothetical protein ES332_D06G108000v1 [Gossypium tomentosum]|uniref:Uncharacterized protein n=1 Tax=Gossypium tomentosum TaxID=34277 RepID=A0A5D2KGI0_GOSTO|nr:hypothetical protein ES332_D06G108000v1 [Gossypium tomentosum]